MKEITCGEMLQTINEVYCENQSVLITVDSNLCFTRFDSVKLQVYDDCSLIRFMDDRDSEIRIPMEFIKGIYNCNNENEIVIDVKEFKVILTTK